MTDKRYVACGKVPGKKVDGQVWSETAAGAVEDFLWEYGIPPEKVLYEDNKGDLYELDPLDFYDAPL